MSVVSHGGNPSIHRDPVRDRVWFERTSNDSQRSHAIPFLVCIVVTDGLCLCFVMHERRFSRSIHTCPFIHERHSCRHVLTGPIQSIESIESIVAHLYSSASL